MSTASRVLHPTKDDLRRPASTDTAERIRRVADELNYRRNPAGRQLRTQRSYEIAVIVPRLSDLVLATMYEAIQDRAEERGYLTYVSNSHDDAARRNELTETALGRRVDGLIFGDAQLDPTFLDHLQSRGVPFVLVNRRSGSHLRSVCDDHLGGRLVADHLHDLGHRRVGLIGGETWASTSVDRMQGFRERWGEFGLHVPDNLIISTGFDALAGFAAAEHCLTNPHPPTAIFAVNDFAAIGAMGASRSAGLRAGEDISIVGYNDISLAAILPVPLTTVRSPMLDIGRGAADLMADILEGHTPESLVWAPEMVVRASTGPAPSVK